MIDHVRQRHIASAIERVVSSDSLVDMPHEAFISMDVDNIALAMMTDETNHFDSNEEFEFDCDREKFEQLLNLIVEDSTYAYFASNHRLKILRDMTKVSDDLYELKIIYRLIVELDHLNVRKDEIHYNLDKEESPYTKIELIDKIAEVYNVDALGLVSQIEYESCLVSLNSISDYLEDASEVDVYDIICEHLSITDLWSDLIAAAGIQVYDQSVFETSQSFVIDLSTIE